MTPGKREPLNEGLTPRSGSLPSWVLILDGETTLTGRSPPSRTLAGLDEPCGPDPSKAGSREVRRVRENCGVAPRRVELPVELAVNQHSGNREQRPTRIRLRQGASHGKGVRTPQRLPSGMSGLTPLSPALFWARLRAPLSSLTA